MQTPKATASAPAPRANLPSTGRALSSMGAALLRGLTRVEAALCKTLDADYGERGRNGSCLEASLLLRLRRGLVPYLREPAAPGKPVERLDGVLADGLLESVEAAQAVVADLEGSPTERYGRWLSFCRELISELVALGEADAQTEKRIAELLQQRLKDPSKVTDALAHDLGNFFVALAARLEQKSPLRSPTLLDEVLRNARAVPAKATPR